VYAAGADLLSGELARVDRHTQTVHTRDDQSLHYDALLLALGAQRVPRYKHALTIDDRRLDESLDGFIQDIEEGYASRIAFVSTGRLESPLPLYELALMTAAYARDMDIALSISILTPEDAPLAIFGSGVSSAMSDLLARARIQTITSAYVEIPSNGRLVIHPGDRRLPVDRVVALPELYGPSLRVSRSQSTASFESTSISACRMWDRSTRPVTLPSSRSSMVRSPHSRRTQRRNRLPRWLGQL
jgi:sulfide:quinone oxidoreductase